MDRAETAPVFLGTRPSRVTTADELPPTFVDLRRRFDEVRELYEDDEITREQYADQLSSLTLIDPNGVEWTIGATTRQWFRRTVEGTWVAAPPPSVHALAAAAALAEASARLDAAPEPPAPKLEADPEPPTAAPPRAPGEGPYGGVHERFAHLADDAD